MANYVQRKSQLVIVLSVAIKIQVPSGGESCVTHYFLGFYRAKRWFDREKFKMHEVGYPKESNMPMSDIRVSTVIGQKIQKIIFTVCFISLFIKYL